ncbi:MAG: hypothetical protein REI94_15025 [Moraxellaceae bacterium]|nr:hypothetical protein [Moraxellaceae bacterium]
MALSARSRMFRQAGAGLVMLAVACSVATAVWLWELRCENFGCTGLGIAWAMWSAAVYAPTLFLGALLHFRFPPAPGWLQAMRGALLLHLAVGLGLACHYCLVVLAR